MLLFYLVASLITGNLFAAPVFSYYSYDQDDKGRTLRRGLAHKIFVDYESNRLLIGGDAYQGSPGDRYAVVSIDPLNPASGTMNVDGDGQDEPLRTGSDTCWDFEFGSSGRFAGIGYTSYLASPSKMSLVIDDGNGGSVSFNYGQPGDPSEATFGYGVTSIPGTGEYVLVGSRDATMDGLYANMELYICVVHENSPQVVTPKTLVSTGLNGGKSALDVLYVEDHIGGDYLLICGRTNVSSSECEPFVLRTDMDGNVAWKWEPETNLGDGNDRNMDVSFDLWIGNDGNIVIAGQYLGESGVTLNGFLAKIRPETDSVLIEKNLERQMYVKEYMGDGGNQIIRGGACRPGGGYVLVGQQYVDVDRIDGFVKLVDENGNELNHYVTDGPGDGPEGAIDVICLSENSFAMAGQVNGLMGYIRLDLDGNAADPVVAITSHSDREVVLSSEDVDVTVAAWDNSGIQRVWLKVDGTWLPSDAVAPYEWNLGNLSTGFHTLRVKAIPNDDSDAFVIADVVVKVVQDPEAVAIISPSSGEQLTDDQNVVVTARASDDSGISRVHLWSKEETATAWIYRGVGIIAGAPDTYEWNISNLPVGTHILRARADANDNDRVVVDVAIEVIPGSADPTVAITSHSEGDQVPVSQDVIVTVDAWDDSGIERVWLRLDTIWQPSVVESPYTWNLGNLSAGYHTLEAMAVSNDVTDPRPTTSIVIRVMESNGLIELCHEDFEDGFGLFTDGDGVGEDVTIATYDDASAKNDAYILSGDASLQLRDNNGGSGSAAEMVECSGAYGYERLVVEFDYVCWSMEAGESFVLEFWLNGSWVVVGRFTVDVHFSNGIRASQAITMIQLAGFASDSKIRFRCDASGDADWVYIDEVRVSAGDQ